MKGRYSLALVRAYVVPGKIGVYMLGRYGDYVHYVGRSDTDLMREMLDAAKRGRYLYFWFQYSPSPMRAYKTECRLWHRHKPSDNTNHLARPADTGWRCPVKGCPYG